jgi:hypothetical protein
VLYGKVGHEACIRSLGFCMRLIVVGARTGWAGWRSSWRGAFFVSLRSVLRGATAPGATVGRRLTRESRNGLTNVRLLGSLSQWRQKKWKLKPGSPRSSCP